MKTLSVALVALLAAAADAAGPKLPTNPTPPQTVYARASVANGKVTLHLKLMQVVAVQQEKPVIEYHSEARIVGGKKVVVKVPAKIMRTYTKMIAKAWREVRIDTAGRGVSVRNAAGKTVAANRLAELLKQDTPVLLSATGPVDPFYLLTVKDNTIVIVVPQRVLYMSAPPAPPLAIPRSGPIPKPSVVPSPRKS